MAIKFYVTDNIYPHHSAPFKPGFLNVRNGYGDYSFGMYMGENEEDWATAVPNANFSVIAIGYDEDKDELCTVLDIERPNGVHENIFWWWQSTAPNEEALHRTCQFLLKHYGIYVIDEALFDSCMSMYRMNKDCTQAFSTLEDLPVRNPDGTYSAPEQEEAPEPTEEPAPEKAEW